MRLLKEFEGPRITNLLESLGKAEFVIALPKVYLGERFPVGFHFLLPTIRDVSPVMVAGMMDHFILVLHCTPFLRTTRQS